MKSLLILYSYHHHNTEKVAGVIAKVLDAQVKTPDQVKPEELQEYDLIGFGSGIYGEKHHRMLLDLADRLPPVAGRKAFLFSTNGMPAVVATPGINRAQLTKNHQQLRNRLQSKGYTIVGDFSCPGFNTNSFLERLGGINKGRPDADDLKQAEEFAAKLKL